MVRRIKGLFEPKRKPAPKKEESKRLKLGTKTIPLTQQRPSEVVAKRKELKPKKTVVTPVAGGGRVTKESWKPGDTQNIDGVLYRLNTSGEWEYVSLRERFPGQKALPPSRKRGKGVSRPKGVRL